MYRIAVCEDDPHTAEQNSAAVCHVLDKSSVSGDGITTWRCSTPPSR